MASTQEKNKSRLSGTETAPNSNLRSDESVPVSPLCSAAEDEKEFQAIMAIISDLKRELEHSWKLQEALREETASLRRSG